MKKCDFSRKNIKYTESQKIGTKYLYGLLFKSYEQFKFLTKIIDGKDALASRFQSKKCEKVSRKLHLTKYYFSGKSIKSIESSKIGSKDLYGL